MNYESLESAIDLALLELEKKAKVNAGVLPDNSLSMASLGVQDNLFHQVAESPENTAVSMGSGSFSIMCLSSTLIEYAWDKQSSKAAVAWLKRLLETRVASAKLVLSFWGVEPSKPISIDDKISLLPIGDLEDSYHKNEVMRHRNPGSSYRMQPPSMWMPPTAVLVQDVVIDPLILTPSEKNCANRTAATRRHMEMKSKFDEVLEIIGATTPCTVIDGGAWLQYDDPEFYELRSGISQSGRSLISMYQKSFGELEDAKLAETWRGFNNLTGKYRDKWWRAVQRVNRAMAWDCPGDSSLELAIALETLLMPDTGEHAYKVALRTALAVGIGQSDCEEIRAKIACLYGVRSKTVHTGSSDKMVKVSGFGQVDVKKLVEECFVIAAKLLRRLAKEGKELDWKRLELSGFRLCEA